MPTYPPVSTTLEAKADGVQAVIDTAIRSAHPTELEPGKVYSLVTSDGRYHKVDLTGSEYRDTPARKCGTTTVRDVDSFLAYWGKHSSGSSEVYADVERRTVTAVLDAHSENSANWGGHRLVLSLRHTTAWRAWTGINGQLMPQTEFAEFIEDNLADIAEPEGAAMLEIAQSFEATTKAEFQSSQRLASGERKFAYVEDTEARAGQRGELTIPATIKLGLRPFEGTEPYALVARFRYRLDKNQLRLGIRLDRPEDILTAAFGDLRNEIDGVIAQAVLNGSPA